MKNVVGIDLGGTNIVGGRIEGNVLVAQLIEKTNATEGGNMTLDILKGIIRRLINEETTAVGIGVPSVVDRERGIVYNVQNIKDWDEVNLKEILEKEFNLPVFVDNDANCFAMGEKIFGMGKELEHFVGITLGTGVGGGIIQGGHLLRDANCGSGEFGELPYLDAILEEYCGSRFFVRTGGITGYEAALKAREGDMNSIALYREYGKHIAMLVKFIVLTVDPQAVIFGGSIAQAFDLFEQSMYEGLQKFPYPNSVKKLKIVTSDLQNSGVLGAGALCMQD